MMNDFWNQRYASSNYVYGTSPNEFLKSELEKAQAPGKLLLPAEGEGRNAVFVASLGWDVLAFDPSSEGMKKALALAKNRNVAISYLLESYDSIELEQESFDVLGLFFAHMPSTKRTHWHQKLLGYLKPGGKLILEAFTEKQLGRDSGGPQSLDMLFSEEKLAFDFSGMKNLEIKTTERVLNEGAFHKGLASTIQLTAIK